MSSAAEKDAEEKNGGTINTTTNAAAAAGAAAAAVPMVHTNNSTVTMQPQLEQSVFHGMDLSAGDIVDRIDVPDPSSTSTTSATAANTASADAFGQKQATVDNDAVMGESADTAADTTTTAAVGFTPTTMNRDMPNTDWVEEPLPEDVMSGRGAAVNAHMGNQRFRALCFARKAEFDAANHSLKRRIATEIVAATPGRFLKRPKNYQHSPKLGNNDANNNHHPYWMVLTHESAILKACQVMRDFRRPDRVALREMAALERLQKTSKRQQLRARLDEHESPPTTTIPTDMDTTQQVVEGNTVTVSTVENPVVANANTTTTVDDVPVGETTPASLPLVGEDGNDGDNDDGTTIVVREHDVLSGRGAFVNAHPGNQEFRRMSMVRKAPFDAGNFTDKRSLAMEIVSTIQERGGRFLQRAKQQPQQQQPQPSLMGGTTWRLPPRGTQGTWESLTDEKAIHKACQVMRDFQRPDRLQDRETNTGLTPIIQLPSPPPLLHLPSNPPHPNLPIAALPPPPTTTPAAATSTILTNTFSTEPLDQPNDSVAMEEGPVVTVPTTELDPSLNGVSVAEELGEGGNNGTILSSENAHV